MAIRRKFKAEDLLVGSFVLCAFLYPFIVTFFIHLQEEKEEVDWRDKLRLTYMFLAGLDECTTDRAVRIAKFIDRNALRKLGGVEGMVRECVRNKPQGDVYLKEIPGSVGKTLFLEVELNVNGELKHIKVYGKGEGRSFRVTGAESYAQRS